MRHRLPIPVRIVFWLVLACPVWAQPLRVATYNVRNYTVENRVVDGQWRPAYPKPETERAALRRVIRAVYPDVLALQEMGGPAFLEELRRDLLAEGLEYPHAALLEGPDPDRRTAVLARSPFASVKRHTDIDFAYFGGRERVKRGLLEVEFALPEGTPGEGAGGVWSFYVVHLKSRYTEREDDPEARVRREREARAIRDHIRRTEDLAGGALVLVAGDFNDHSRSDALERFTEVNSRPLLTMLDARDSRGELWTYFYDKQDRYERIDYLLASPALSGRVTRARIHDGPNSLRASDHRLVWADLEFLE